MKEMPKLLSQVEGRVFGGVLGKAAEKFPVVSEDDRSRKSINESSEPVVGCLGLCD